MGHLKFNVDDIERVTFRGWNLLIREKHLQRDVAIPCSPQFILVAKA